ncbi:MAG TPA: histidine kinase, partial [Tenuifilaceae bacterium]|nr:histidine kinase [Tenuifilaceae bacterium]
NLWIACYGNGLSCFDGKTFLNFSEKDGLVNNNIRKIRWSTKHNGLLIGTVFGFSFLKDSQFTSFKDSSVTNRSLLQVTDFLEVDSLIYLFTYYDNEQFIVFNPSSKQFRYLDRNHRYHLKSNKSTCAFISSLGDTLIGHHLFGMKIYKRDTVIVNTTVGQVFDIVEDNHKNLWLASWNDGQQMERTSKGGLYRYSNNQMEYYNDKLGINSQECWCLYFDKSENTLWVGTSDKGIVIFPMTGIEYTPASLLNSKFPYINDIFPDSKNNEWLSVGDKILINRKETPRLDKRHFSELYKKILKNDLIKLTTNKEKEKLLYKVSMSTANTYSYIYIDTIKLDSVARQYKTMLDNYNNGIDNFYRFAEDEEGNVWVTTSQGTYILNKEDLSIKAWGIQETSFELFFDDSIVLLPTQYLVYRYNKNFTELLGAFKLRKNATWSSNIGVLKDSNQYWLFTNTDGLALYKNGIFKPFPYLADSIDIEFNAMCKDMLGNIIAGTNSGKIHILKYNNDSILVKHTISKADGIVGNEIGWMVCDRRNRLWFTTNKGLNVINLNELYTNRKITVQHFNKNNGFTDFTTSKGILDSSGNLIVVSKSNLIRINPEQLLASSSPESPIVLDNIEVNFKQPQWDNSINTSHWTGLPSGKFQLPYTDNSLTFHYHLLSYTEINNAQYSYILEGHQKEWTPYSPDTKLVLTNLRPDKYKLRIKGFLHSNPDSTSELLIEFSILPPWWRTWWAYTGYGLVLLAILLFVYRRKIKTLDERNKVNTRISELKLEALKAQLNPHFVFNAFSSIQLYILKQDTKNALEYLSKFAKLIRMTLDNSTRNRIPLTEEIEFLRHYLDIEKKRVQNLDYSIHVGSNLDIETTNIPPMLIQPLVENAIMHGIRHMDSN